MARVATKFQWAYEDVQDGYMVETE